MRLTQSGWRRSAGSGRSTSLENGVTREFGADARTEDCERLGHKEVILRRDGEFASMRCRMRSRRGGNYHPRQNTNKKFLRRRFRV